MSFKKNPPILQRKYPYFAEHEADPDWVVLFVGRNTGVQVATASGNRVLCPPKNGTFKTTWAEEYFKPISGTLTL